MGECFPAALHRLADRWIRDNDAGLRLVPGPRGKPLSGWPAEPTVALDVSIIGDSSSAGRDRKLELARADLKQVSARTSVGRDFDTARFVLHAAVRARCD